MSHNAAIGAWVSATTLITASGGNVNGIQLNGYIFDTSPTAASATSTATPTVAGGFSLSSSPARSGMSRSSVAGVGVGVTLALVGFCALVTGCLMIRWYRQKAARVGVLTTHNNGTSPPYLSPEVSSWVDRPTTNASHHGSVYEMGVGPKGMY